MKADGSPSRRCGLDTVEIARMERLLSDTPPEKLDQLFTVQELEDAGNGAGRVASLAARFAAKEACCKLFPRELAHGQVQPTDFSICRDGYGAPQVVTTPGAQAVLDRNYVGNLRVSLTHTDASASAIAWADAKRTDVPWVGMFLYYVVPFRRGVVLGNLRRVFGEVLPEWEIRRLAQAFYAHYIRFLVEFLRLPFMSAEKRRAWIRVENIEAITRAHQKGKGILLLTGHFGNWEVSTVAGIGQFPQYRNLFHFVRRPLKPRWFNDYVTRRFQRAGFGTIAKRGSLDRILDLLAGGAVVVYVFDQHAAGSEGIPVDFFGQPAGTFKSLALIALSAGSPVVPASSWREPDGTHVLRFEEALPLIECEKTSETIWKNTRAYNAALERMLLRHPEQWIWMHKRWKVADKKPAAP